MLRIPLPLSDVCALLSFILFLNTVHRVARFLRYELFAWCLLLSELPRIFFLKTTFTSLKGHLSEEESLVRNYPMLSIFKAIHWLK